MTGRHQLHPSHATFQPLIHPDLKSRQSLPDFSMSESGSIVTPTAQSSPALAKVVLCFGQIMTAPLATGAPKASPPNNRRDHMISTLQSTILLVSTVHIGPWVLSTRCLRKLIAHLLPRLLLSATSLVLLSQISPALLPSTYETQNCRWTKS